MERNRLFMYLFIVVILSACSINIGADKTSDKFTAEEHLTFARSYKTLGEYENAIEEYKFYLQKNKNADVYIELVELLESIYKIRDAKKSIAEAKENFPQNKLCFKIN